jgi:peptidoglycan/LPS O-acetylase OafA/YrhL
MLIGLVMLAVLTKHLPTYSLSFPLALSGFVFVFAYMTPVVGWLERFGDPSYGIYLWGWPCQQLVAFFVPAAGLFVHVTLSLTMAVLFGYASWHLVEKHALKFK